MRCKVLAFAALVMAAMVSPIHAQSGETGIVFNVVTDAATYTGNSVTVNVYLQESDPSGTTKSIIGTGGLATIGGSGSGALLSAGFAINYVSGGVGATITSVSANTNATNANGSGTSGPGFGTGGLSIGTALDLGNSLVTGQASTTGSGTNAGVNNSTGVTPNGPVATLISGGGTSATANVYQLYLGSVTIAITSGTATYSVTSIANSGDSALSGQAPSGLFQGQGGSLNTDVSKTNGVLGGGKATWKGANSQTLDTFTVSPGVAGVPEPSSMVLCGFAISGLGVSAWRRRKSGKVTETELETVAAV